MARLRKEYPDAKTELRWEDPLQLLVATILSAQSTDVRVNEVTQGLFERYRAAERKTANVVLGNAFGIDEGVVVDTHVRRVSGRLGLTEHHDPEKIERDLLEIVPEGERTLFSHLLIFHGRRVCKARKPDCLNCALNHVCPSAFKE
ncbi:MAG: endonuclease III [Actinobacteria bacterium]|nr:endonuclease III [Actinomycetota bacterium]